MDEELAFSEDFYNALESAKGSFDRGLIYLIHVLQAVSPSDAQKQKACDDILAIGHEMNAFFTSVKLDEITRYNVKDHEKRIVAKLTEAKSAIASFTASIDAKLKLTIDPRAAFSINDIVARLGESKIYGSFALTKDKLDDLLVLRRFIVRFYEALVGKAKKNEKKLDKDFYDLKLKTFLGSLRNPSNRNPDFYFLSVSLFTKLLTEGIALSIADPGQAIANRDEVFFFIVGENKFVIAHNFGGKRLRCELSKLGTARGYRYEIAGSIEMKGENVEYSIQEDIPSERIESFEHIMELDFLWSQYDRAYLAHSREYNDLKNRAEEGGKSRVQAAAFEALFGG